MTNARTVLLWTAIALSALAYVAAGGAKVLGTQQMAEGFRHFGLPLWLMTVVGVCEVAGAIGLLIRPLSMWAAIGLAIIMIGAAGLHLVYDGFAMALPALVLLALMVYVAWQRRGDALFIARPAEGSPSS
jgi:uncharacterized membrane protein YphA (DoxX/SURF4 family)